MAAEPGHGAVLGIVVATAGYDRVHTAFLLAAGAAALGRSVTMFATGPGVWALHADHTRLHGAAEDRVIQARGVPGLDELRTACLDLGVHLLACPAGLRGQLMAASDLLTGAKAGGMAEFLETTRDGQLITL